MCWKSSGLLQNDTRFQTLDNGRISIFVDDRELGNGEHFPGSCGLADGKASSMSIRIGD